VVVAAVVLHTGASGCKSATVNSDMCMPLHS
jgi:hypothetical protein